MNFVILLEACWNYWDVASELWGFLVCKTAYTVHSVQHGSWQINYLKWQFFVLIVTESFVIPTCFCPIRVQKISQSYNRNRILLFKVVYWRDEQSSSSLGAGIFSFVTPVVFFYKYDNHNCPDHNWGDWILLFFCLLWL